MDNMIYKERRLSKTEEMFHAVFSSKAVLAILILSVIVCLANIGFAVMCGYITSNFTLQNIENYIGLFPDIDDSAEAIEGLYLTVSNLIWFFGLLAMVYLWIALGTLLIYIRAKRLDYGKPIRTGFTILQAFGITKLVTEGLGTLFSVFVGFALLSDAETFIAGILVIAVLAVNFMYTLSIIAFCSSVKKTADGIVHSSSGAGTLQFSAFITGIVQGIAAVLFMILMLAPLEETEDIPAESIALIESIRLYMMAFTAVWILTIVIHFLVFAAARHYAVKLPLAANADMVYKQNMANLYPQQMYDPNQTYQSPQTPYSSGQTYPSPQTPYPSGQNYMPFQPPENYQGYVPYDSTNDVDDHSRIDNTPYPPYDSSQNR